MLQRLLPVSTGVAAAGAAIAGSSRIESSSDECRDLNRGQPLERLANSTAANERMKTTTAASDAPVDRKDQRVLFVNDATSRTSAVSLTDRT